MSMRRRMAKGLVSLLYSRATVVIGQFIQVPILTAVWGVKVWGSWLVLTALASFLSYSAIGLTPVVRSEAAMAFGRGDLEHMRKVVSTGLAVVGTVAIVGYGLFATIALSVNPEHLFKDPVLPTADARFILLCLGAQIGTNAISGVLYGSLSGRGSYGLSQSIDATRVLLEFVVLSSMVLIFRIGPAQAAAIFPVLALGALSVAASTHIPRQFRPSLSAVSPSMLRQLWRPMAGGLMLQFSYGTLLIQAPRLILSQMVGPSAVAMYAVASFVVRPARMVTETIAMMLPVEFSFSYASGDLMLTRRLLSNSIMLGGLCALLASGFLVGLGPIAVKLLSLGAIPVDRLTIAFLCIGLFAIAFSLAATEFLLSINRIFGASMLLTLFAAPYVVASYGMAKGFGLHGMALSAGLMDCFNAAFTLSVAARCLQTTPWVIISDAFRSPLPLLKQEAGLIVSKLAPWMRGGRDQA